jgi:anaerobic magnesium-protoporphyrin IX monomethyl ester cyclase
VIKNTVATAAISIMKILLVNPSCETGSARWLPLGLGYIAAVLKGRGFDVKVIDGPTDNVLQDYMPDVIGISAMTPQIEEAWRIADRAKAFIPNVTVILGGVHPSILPLESIAKPAVDIVVVGEGELTMVCVCSALLYNLSLEKVQGIVYKSHGEVVSNPPREVLNNLDELPFPARELFNFPDGYTPGYYRHLPAATILTSRGCPGRCTFCNKSVFGNRSRMRTAHNVFQEMMYLHIFHGIREFHISDDNFTTDRQRAIDICDFIIKAGMKVSWACSNGIRVDCVCQELLNKMKQAGCYRIAFGIESGSPKILKSINKNITLDKIDTAVRMARKAGLITVGFFMVGNYGETDETISETIKFIDKLKLDYIQFTIATPYPGTELAEQVSAHGRVLAKRWSEYNTYTGSIIEWENLSKREIDEFQMRMYRVSYMNFNYIFNRLLRIRTLCDLKFMLKGLKIFRSVSKLGEPNR